MVTQLSERVDLDTDSHSTPLLLSLLFFAFSFRQVPTAQLQAALDQRVASFGQPIGNIGRV